MSTAILLISEQTLPNIQFIKQMGPFERYIFLTTPKMKEQGKGDAIIRATRLQSNQVRKVIIDPENPNLSLDILRKHSWPEGQLLIHLTGGTKMMALATFAFFSSRADCQIVYLPINTNSLIRVHPEPGEIPLDITISFEEYLTAYGVVIQDQQMDWIKKAKRARGMMAAISEGNNAPLLELTAQAIQKDFSPEDKRFYGGEWLEIWLAWAIHHYWSVPVKDIRVGVKLNRIGVTATSYYEYDVMFIRDSRLFVAECKFFNGYKFELRKINKELFKFASVTAQLGLYARPFFAIANRIDNATQQQALSDQCQILKLPYPADLTTLSQPERLLQFLQNL